MFWMFLELINKSQVYTLLRKLMPIRECKTCLALAFSLCLRPAEKWSKLALPQPLSLTSSNELITANKSISNLHGKSQWSTSA